MTIFQQIPDPDALESPLPGGVARAVHLFFNVPQWLQIGGIVLGGLLASTVALVAWRRRESIWMWLRTRPRLVYAWAAGVGAFLVIAAASGGVWGWHYVQHDNRFCIGCHVMGPAFERFAESEHSSLECHDCHQQPLTASIRQVYLWIAERPEEIGEHAPVPSAVCAQCHIQDDPRETWQAIAATEGHRVHLTSDSPALAGAQCVTCHAREVHRFAAAAETCGQSGCHRSEDTSIVLGSMSGIQTTSHCLGCHQFLRAVPADPGALGEPAMVPALESCGHCHPLQPLLDEFVPGADPHRAVCGACHNPHTQTAPEAAFGTCTTAGCHTNPEGLTAFHRGLPAGVVETCSTCHSAHAWVADASDCRGCHRELSD